MKVEYTRHAIERMTERRLTVAEVEALLNTPLIERTERDGRWSRWALIDGHGVKVVFAEDGEKLVVVTALYQRRRPQP